MANKQISGLDALTKETLDDEAMFVVQQSNTAYKIIADELKQFLQETVGITNISYSSSTGILTITCGDGQTYTTTDIRGEDGEPGLTPTITCTPFSTPAPGGYHITITIGESTQTVTINNGQDGSGSVSSVNNVSPVGGNVTLTAANVGAASASDLAAKENIGKITINNTEYGVRLASSGDTGLSGYITFVV